MFIPVLCSTDLDASSCITIAVLFVIALKYILSHKQEWPSLSRTVQISYILQLQLQIFFKAVFNIPTKKKKKKRIGNLITITLYLEISLEIMDIFITLRLLKWEWNLVPHLLVFFMFLWRALQFSSFTFSIFLSKFTLRCDVYLICLCEWDIFPTICCNNICVVFDMKS